MPEPKTEILIVVPERIGALAMVLGQHYVTSEDIDLSDDGKIEEALRSAIGQKVGIEIHADVPFTALDDITAAVRHANGVYWGFHDSFTEPSRGERCPGCVYVCLGGEPRQMTLKWEDGEPGFDVRTLTNAGFSQAEADGIDARFFTAAASPKPA